MRKHYINAKILRYDICDGNETFRTLDTSDPRHFGTILAGPDCAEVS